MVVNDRNQTEVSGLWYGFLGVASFSLTLPATHVAVSAFDPTVVTLARALIAALLAATMLWMNHQRLPSRSQWRSLAVVAATVILGFPLLSSWAMKHVPSSHGAIVLGLLPLATAGFGALRAGERPSLGFWLASITGSGVVIGFALFTSGGHLQLADLALVGAVLAASLGYAEGGRLARDLGGWQVISWALILAAPFLLVPMILAVRHYGIEGPPSAWLGLGYLGIVSQFLGFIAWYKGLALGGVARVSQLQLLQPFMTIMASGLLLGEHVTLVTCAAALGVVLTVAVGRKAQVAGSVAGSALGQ